MFMVGLQWWVTVVLMVMSPMLTRMESGSTKF